MTNLLTNKKFIITGEINLPTWMAYLDCDGEEIYIETDDCEDALQDLRVRLFEELEELEDNERVIKEALELYEECPDYFDLEYGELDDDADEAQGQFIMYYVMENYTCTEALNCYLEIYVNGERIPTSCGWSY